MVERIELRLQAKSTEAGSDLRSADKARVIP